LESPWRHLTDLLSPSLSAYPPIIADLPVNNDILGKMMSEGDLAGTGSIDFTAFITMMSKKMKKVRPLL
jgi:Ca2+-binding EF-hand superfamily protein